jgi:protein gp37
MTTTSIEWTQATWNPVTGCTKISAGCLNCYAERMATRLQAMGQENYRNGFALACHPQMLDLPRRWRKPRLIFVNSMGDLFHKDVPLSFIKDVFNVISSTPRHTYQLLTKRSERLEELSHELSWPMNLWMGVSVESEEVTWRIDNLRRTPAAVRFLSIEPLLGPIPSLGLDDIDWVIVGGESGPKARPMKEEWVLEIKAQCKLSQVPFFFKQWGGVRKKSTGRKLEGRTWDEMPVPAGWHKKLTLPCT